MTIRSLRCLFLHWPVAMITAWAVSFAFVMPAAAIAEGEPVLQIELGTHAAPVRGIAATADGTLAITVSGDKSARIWNLADKRLRHVFRPAVGPGEIGALYGVAAHPTQDLVAVAGTTTAPAGASAPPASSGTILLFRPSTNALVRTIDARGNDITRLAFTPDGQLLLATYRDGGAFRAFDVQGTLVFEERFAQASYGLAVSAEGRIAVTAYEGKVSLYQYSGGAVVAQSSFRTAIPAPRSVAYSPDGSRLAVGYRGIDNQMGAPTIHDADTGRESFALPRPRTLLAGNIANIAFDAGGTRLYAAGSAYERPGTHPVLRYDLTSRSLIDQVDVATNTVTDLLTVKDTLLFASFDGSWGSIGPDMRPGAAAAPLADLRGPQNLLIDAAARTIAVAMRNGMEPQTFDLATRTVVPGPAPGGMRAPIVRDPRRRHARWENTYEPIVNGRPIAMAGDEVSRAIAYPRDSAHALLGTNQRLIRLDPDGAVQWAVAAPAEIWSLNVRADGDVVVGALADGTVRWWRIADGQLMVSLLMIADGRWILWTPDGHFDASAGGDRLAGWLVNREAEPVADFHSLNRFRDPFNQPGIIDRLTIADPGNDRTAITAAIPPTSAPPRFPPVLSLAGVGRHDAATGELAIPFLLRGATGATVIARIDGRPAPQATIALGEQVGELRAGEARLMLPADGGSVQLLAHVGDQWSEPLIMSVVSPAQASPVDAGSIRIETIRPQPAEAANIASPPRPASAQPAAARADAAGAGRDAIARRMAPETPLRAASAERKPGLPRLFILAIGVSNYRTPAYQLGLPAKDAGDFAAVLKRQAGRNYAEVHTRVLTDAQASLEGILEGFEWLRSAPDAQDVGILFLAGHGLNAEAGEYHFLPWDGDHEALAKTAVPESAIRRTLGNMRGKALLFVDTCYAGGAVGTMKSARRELANLANDLASSENGVVVFASSTGRQLSEENEAWGNGAFTKAAIDGMQGKADFQRTGRITYKALDFYISDEVRRLTDGRQTPVTISPVGVPDFAIVRNETT